MLYLCVTHAGCSDEGLLDGVALGEGRLLLCLWRPHAPVALDEVLHHLHVAPEGCMNQSALPVLIQVVHLLTNTELFRKTDCMEDWKMSYNLKPFPTCTVALEKCRLTQRSL